MKKWMTITLGVLFLFSGCILHKARIEMHKKKNQIKKDLKENH